MKKIIMISGLILACITQANCQIRDFYSRHELSNPAYIHTRFMVNPQIDRYNRFPSREDLKRLKENLEKIMFYNPNGYTSDDKIQVKNSINDILSQQVNGLINLNNFIIYGCFSEDIKRAKLFELNKCILDTFDRKSGIYREAYNNLAQIGVNISSYPLPVETDSSGNITEIPHYYFE